MTKLVDGKARELIRTALDRNVLVEAAAGTGKTTELVERIIAVLASGQATVNSIVAVTFTEKAAGELKLRIRAKIESARQRAKDGDEGDRLENALARLEEARVGTIHGFCADLLRERSVEARVDPEFRVMTEADARRLYAEAFQFWLQGRLEDPPEGVRRALRRISRDGPLERLKGAGWKLAEWRDFPAPWRRDPFDREQQVDALVEQLHHFAGLARRCLDPEHDRLFLDTERGRRLSDTTRASEAVRSRDYDWLEAEFVFLRAERKFRSPRRGSGITYGEGLKREEVLEAHRRFRAALEEFTGAADADLAALVQRDLLEVTERYERQKERSGRLDFVDLLLRTRDLVRDCKGVREDFQRRFTHIFIDEFQDTDPLQAEILLLLASEDPAVTDWRKVKPAAGKLFLVGDPKQSIYRFRRADVETYFEVRDLLKEQADTLCLELTTSFRAVPAVQRAVNSAFAGRMDGDRESLQAEYVELSPWREDTSKQPAIVALPVPEPYGYRGVTKWAIERSLPDAVAAFVQWLLNDSGWTVTTREDPARRVPIVARHVCLLFRRFDSFFSGDMTRGYVQALEARGIRHLLVGGRSFHEREEVETLRTALTAIEWPDDELSVFATLRGPLMAVGDEELLEYRHRFGRLHPFRPPKDDLPRQLSHLPEALELLAELHLGRNHRPVAETVNLLLERTRAHAGFALRPSGEQVLANVLHLADQARDYEGGGGISFRAFVERLIEDADGGRAPEAPILEEGSDGVRIMTVHKAKGLEFPAVILADIGANLVMGQAGRTIDPERRLCASRIGGWSPIELLEREPDELKRDAAEGVRLTYVAATRARDLLVVPAVGDGPLRSSWVSPLDAAIYPDRDRWSLSGDAEGCPTFGEHSVLNAPDARYSESVKPGLHYFLDRQYGVVWWDPATLELRAPPVYGVRDTKLISKDADPVAIEEDKRRHAEWQAERAATVERASRPSIRLRTATELAALIGEAADEERQPEQQGANDKGASTGGRGAGGDAGGGQTGGPVVEVVELPIEEGRPRGKRFGALVHTVLATAPLSADEEQLRSVAELQGRILGAARHEITAAVQAASEVLKHSLLERARRAAERGDCRRETPVTMREPDGALVDGVVDLAFLEGETWIVVDFKTDRELQRALPVYRRQLELYSNGIASATGQQVSAVLVRV